MSDDDITVDTIARFVYASELLAPGADMDGAPVYDKLPATEKRRLREIAAREIASLDAPASVQQDEESKT